jgi:hypothetical protein
MLSDAPPPVARMRGNHFDAWLSQLGNQSPTVARLVASQLLGQLAYERSGQLSLCPCHDWAPRVGWQWRRSYNSP